MYKWKMSVFRFLCQLLRITATTRILSHEYLNSVSHHFPTVHTIAKFLELVHIILVLIIVTPYIKIMNADHFPHSIRNQDLPVQTEAR